jgi:hypothetical protein
MSYLKETFLRSLEMIENIDKVPPIRFRYQVGIIYVGEIKSKLDDPFPVTIKTDDGELGWLYSDNGAIVFVYGGNTFAVRLRKLRERVEDVLSDKTFITNPDDAKHGVMYRDGKSIEGYINFEEVYKLRTPLW